MSERSCRNHVTWGHVTQIPYVILQIMRNYILKYSNKWIKRKATMEISGETEGNEK